MAAAPLYCVCRQPYDVNRFMIECDICKDWFHGSCVRVEEHHAVDIDVYHCPNCEVLHGPSMMKKRRNFHRHDYTEPDDGSKPVQAGTLVFVRQLQERTFASADEVLVEMQGSQVTQRYLERHGFRYPIAVTQNEGLGLQLPSSDFTVKDVERYVGGDKVIDVIDVARQADSKMKLKEFVKYYYSRQRPKVLNVISLEFSDTKMSELVVVPDIAQKMSWVENYWPDDSYFPKPFVQKYCLMGVKGSYTDFHIDFGGTSVWYHVLWGEKVFYLIKPTPANLALYEEWSSSPNQSEMFFGEKVDKCYKCVVRPGTTLFIPTGWIHGVLTSEDCMAFGGNFLHNLNIGMQLRCYEMERRLKTPDLFKFPYFEAICWYVAKNLLETLKDVKPLVSRNIFHRLAPVLSGFAPKLMADFFYEYLGELISPWRSARTPSSDSPHLITKPAIVYLTFALPHQVTEPASEVPDHIRPNHLIKELTKEIRHVEEDQSGNAGSKPVKWCFHERGSHIRKNGRKLRHHHHHHHHHQNHHHHHAHVPKPPSNLDIFEQHTQEVLKRLETRRFEDDSSFNLKVKFNKVSTASAAAAESKLDNHLRLVMCNGRIMRCHVRKKSSSAKEEADDHKRYMLKVHVKEEETEQVMEEKKLSCAAELCKFESSDLRNDVSGCGGDLSDCKAEGRYATQVQQASATSAALQIPPTPSSSSDTTTNLVKEEDAIQGMLTMAGLLYPHPSEEGTNSQESWWSCNTHPSPDYNGKEAGSGEENPDSDSNSTFSSQDERQMLKHRGREKWTDRSQRLQDSQSFMDSQGSSNSSDAWGSHTLSPRGEESPESHYQYCETSLSPLLHPTKRPATNPPPVSNQATKGKRPKKGMATAKQRLGKILKLNRHKSFFV
ncbi:lysine-specific demethylase 7B isoform X1 [Silurus asotus]|uniref:Lysine-specific demethylase 7B isoform X1 n=1 Tax=Silurus asotus TaxID=30991 RepID=A0AAD5AK29_SILAS|nr:lysine-specific demethylase 7B isoform X1 [Silurus asotus]